MIEPMIPFADQTPSVSRDVPFPAPPNSENWLGTDDQGRDVLARVLYGLRVSLLFGLALTVAGSIIGIAVGAVQGYFGGWTDLVGQRLMEVWGGLPQLFMIIILVSLFSPSVFVLFGLMLLFGWMGLVGLVRAEFCEREILIMYARQRRWGCQMPRLCFAIFCPMRCRRVCRSCRLF